MRLIAILAAEVIGCIDLMTEHERAALAQIKTPRNKKFVPNTGNFTDYLN